MVVNVARRELLIAAATSGLAAVLTGCGQPARPGRAAPDTTRPSGTGPSATGATTVVTATTVPDVAGADEVGGVALAPGFSAAVLSQSGERVPGAFDGMAAFAGPAGEVRLVRNHERKVLTTVLSPFDTATAYDATGPGGTSTLVLAPGGRALDREFVSLSGTLGNCAGGVTPSGTWLSCEETVDGPGEGFGKDHGYVFEVWPGDDAPRPAQPLLHLGRFLHEAVAVDAATAIIYLTEDNGYDSGLYRFVPNTPSAPTAAGKLEMLAVTAQPAYDTAFGQPVGTTLSCGWVAITDPNPPGVAPDNTSLVFNQGLVAGGARFKRLEGCCIVDRTLYVTSTEGGDAGLGQVWALQLDRDELQLVAESTEPDVLFGPDNISPLPGGGPLVVCEDNAERNRLLVLDPAGTFSVLAENVADTTEFAGTCVSPDGQTLYVNVYGDEATGVPARTLAIWGPWESLRSA